MNKVKVEELKCFDQVASVIGKSRARVELFKVLQVYQGKLFSDSCLNLTFVWDYTPQGFAFSNLINKGENPYKV